MTFCPLRRYFVAAVVKDNATNRIVAAFAFVTMLGLAAPAGASTIVFSDNFNSLTQGLGYTGAAFPNWVVTSGSVDVIGAGGPYDYYPGHGNYVDLDGSTNAPGQLTTNQSFAPGTYTLSFLLGGSTGGSGNVDPTPKTTVVTFGLGDFSQSITLASNAGLTSYSFTFTSTQLGALVFTDLICVDQGCNNNVGNILDDVTLTQTPLPAALPLFATGLGLMGMLSRRRKRKARAALNAA